MSKSALALHSALRPGLLESACEACLAHESGARVLCVARQVAVPIRYKGVEVDAGYRIDRLVSGVLSVELKSADRLAPLRSARRPSDSKPGGKGLGYLLNFDVVHTRNGIKKVVNGS